VLIALKDMVYKVEVPIEIGERARGAIEAMIRI
jgi:quinolinate synthase